MLDYTIACTDPELLIGLCGLYGFLLTLVLASAVTAALKRW